MHLAYLSPGTLAFLLCTGVRDVKVTTRACGHFIQDVNVCHINVDAKNYLSRIRFKNEKKRYIKVEMGQTRIQRSVSGVTNFAFIRDYSKKLLSTESFRNSWVKSLFCEAISALYSVNSYSFLLHFSWIFMYNIII